MIDVVAWDNALFQDMGLLVRGTDIGLGTTGGYAISYDVDEGKAYLSRLDSEAAATLASEELPLELDKDYRFQISAIGKQITGTLFDAAAPDVPLLILTAEDDLYTEGDTGIFTNAGVPDGSTDATFDNFAVFDPTAPRQPLMLTELRLLEDKVQVGFSVSPAAGERYLFESSADLTSWSPLAERLVPLGQVQGSFETSRDAGSAHYYRVGVRRHSILKTLKARLMVGHRRWTQAPPSGSWARRPQRASPQPIAARKSTARILTPRSPMLVRPHC